MKTKHSFEFYFYILVYLVFTFLLFFIVEKAPEIASNPNLVERRIESSTKLALNGYFGVFANLMYVGVVSWIFIPLSLILFYRNKYIFHSQYPIVLFIGLSLLLIAVKGYFNERYQLTVLPVIVILSIYFIFSIVNQKILTKILSVHLIIVTLFFGYYFKVNFYKKFISSDSNSIESFSSLVQVPDLIIYAGDSLYKNVFIVDNVPEFYYQNLKGKGYYYSALNDILFLPFYKKKLINENSIVNAKLMDSLKVQYFLTSIKSCKNNSNFNGFLEKNFYPIKRDENGMLLWQLK